MEFNNTCEKIARTYNFLEDEESKIIFTNELMYNITKDKKFIVKSLFDSYKIRNKACLDRIINDNLNKENKIIIFAAGNVGRFFAEALKSINVEVSYFSDNNKELFGTTIDGIEVIEPKKLEEYIGKSLIFVATTSIKNCIEINRQLLDMGYESEQIISTIDAFGEVYMGDGLFRFGDNEVIIDGGSFDGEDAFKINSVCTNTPKIFAVEPDKKNALKIKEKLRNYKNIELVNSGLYNEETTLRFLDTGSQLSSIDNNGTILIETTTIDKISEGYDVTFIKMDIEGAELAALKGAEKSIKDNHPNLAISIYHKPEDIFELPNYIKSLVPEYKIYIRKYSFSSYDTIMYATVK